MSVSAVHSELKIPKKYTKPNQGHGRIEAVVNRNWLRQLLKYRRVPEFVHHEKLSDDEISSLFKQDEQFSQGWQKIIIIVLKKEDTRVIPLPRVRLVGKPEPQLSLSQILQYVSHTNYKNLWKEASRKHNNAFTQWEPCEDSYVQLTDQASLVREVLSRTYGAPLIKLQETQCYNDNNFSPHANLLPSMFLIESSKNFFVIHERSLEHTVEDCVTFSPALLSGSYSKPMFIIYQLLRLMRHLHDMGLVLGNISLADIYIGSNLWIQVIPNLMDNMCPAPEPTFVQSSKTCTEEKKDMVDLVELTAAWIYGAVSNYDYLCKLNSLAGRRFGDPRSHYVLPWVSDFTSRSGNEWRDLTKSKFRLNKGDRQLDLTYDLPPSANSAQIPHHVSDVLSEITYYVYLSRVTPKPVLCKYVRPQWVPAEYPASIQRLQAWSPDECIPEFFTDPTVFKSIHSDLGDLEVPPWCSSPQEFVAKHRAMLESQYVSERLHHWIDLTFGYKLSGQAAIRSKNVCLQLVDGHKDLTGFGIVQLFSYPHPHRLMASPYWGKTPPRIHQQRRKSGQEEDDCHSSGLEEEEPPQSSPLTLSRLISRSRTSLISSPLSSTPDPEKVVLPIPKDYNPVAALNVVESLHAFSWFSNFQPPKMEKACQEKSEIQQCKQIVAAKRAKEMQVLGCLIVELFLAEKIRVFGTSRMTLEQRLAAARSVVFHSNTLLPRCVKSLVYLLLQDDYPIVTSSGVPPPCAHQLLQPLITSSSLVHFPKGFSSLYFSLVSLVSYTRAMDELGGASTAIALKVSQLKVMSLANNIEQLVEGNDICLNLILPFITEMLNSSQTDVLAAWYLFDHVARALGPKKTTKYLLETMLRLYDCECPREPHLLKKRVKLYHRSFMIKLIVRFGLSTFLDNFILPLVEAVGGYHDVDQTGHSHLGEVEEAVEADASMLLSPLDEDSSADSEKASHNLCEKELEETEPEVFHLEEDSVEDNSKSGPKSAISIQNLLIDNLDSLSIDERDGDENKALQVTEGSLRRKSYASIKHLHLDNEPIDIEYSKVYVGEVCEVSGETVVWLAQRLGPVLTARHLSRNLLRMLGLCYTGRDNLIPIDDLSHQAVSTGTVSLVGDTNAFHVLRCLTSIATLYGEQVILVQYMGHVTDLVLVCRRKITGVLEGALIGCLSLVTQCIGTLSDQSLAEMLNDSLIKGLLLPSLRLLASFSVVLPSGLNGRKALALKTLSALVCLVRRADHKQRLVLLQTVQRFFLTFSKVYDHTPERQQESSDVELKQRNKLKDDIYESPPKSTVSSMSEADNLRSLAQEELRETLNPEFAFLAYKPFADFFGESVMEQNLKNFDLVKHLCEKYLKEKSEAGCPIPGTCNIEPPEIVEGLVETPIQVGSFSNVVVVGNRIDIQDSLAKGSSPGIQEESVKSKKVESHNRHLHGNWLAYWEHELGRNSKDTKMNIKQIKLQTFVGHCNSVKHIVTLASENSFMSASRDKTVRLWSLRSQGDGSHISQAQWTYNGHRKSVLCLGWLERHRLAVSSDSCLHLWDPFVGRPVVLSLGDSSSSGLSGSGNNGPTVNVLRPIHPPSSCIACGMTDGTVKTLDARTGSFVNELKVSQNPGGLIRCIVVSPNSSWLGIGQASGMLTVLDLTSGAVLSSWKAHDAEILQLVAVDEHRIMSSALDQAVSVWNIQDGKLLFNLKGPTEPVHCLEMAGGEVISGTTANRIGVHTSIDMAASFSSTRLRSDTFKGVLTSMAVLPLNRILLLGADSGIVTLIC
ncbi:WD repeat-containing protein 81 isoform X1 [Cimex lectularius]|uniref:BEACH domain-containing protein n=1 Tax=Cimex lectularius TaxID=79782 RepID=A0A8I6SCA3_CIMLE|nr:WD repeat-containing protein 81 isoform X1 [Cimex lectularius]